MVADEEQTRARSPPARASVPSCGCRRTCRCAARRASSSCASASRRGELGTLYHAEGDYDYGRRHKLTDGWRGAEPAYSVVLGGAIHLVDLLLWLTGERPDAVDRAVGGGIATRGTALRARRLRARRPAVPERDDLEGRPRTSVACRRTSTACAIYGTEATFAERPARRRAARGRRLDRRSRRPIPACGKSDLIGPFVDSIVTGEPAGRSAPRTRSPRSACASRSSAHTAPARREPRGRRWL